MTDYVPVFINELTRRTNPDGSEIIAGQRASDTEPLGTTADEFHDYRYHVLNRAPTTTDNTAAGYEDRHIWIDTSATPPAVHLKTGETSGSAVWSPLSVSAQTAATKLVETSGPDTLDMGDVLNGQVLRRVGNEIVGVSGVGTVVEGVIGDHTLTPADHGKILLVASQAATPSIITLPDDAGTGVAVKVVNVGDGRVQIVEGGSSGIIPVGADTTLYPAGSSLHQADVYTAGTPTWFVALTGKREEHLTIALGDETTEIEALPARVTFRAPFGMYLTRLRATLNTPGGVGEDTIFDVSVNDASILSTKVSIDGGEETSDTAATPAVISDDFIPDNAEVSIDIDQVGENAGTGPKMTFYYYRE